MSKPILIPIILLAAFFAGCAVAPPAQEVYLPDQDLSSPRENSELSRLVIYNDSNSLMYGLDGSGKINVFLDGKGVGQLSIGQYVMVEVSEGEHTIDLAHKDMAVFKSTHVVEIKGPEEFLKIYAKVTSNGAEIVPAPEDFSQSFKAAY